jgi:hypothetical protein
MMPGDHVLIPMGGALANNAGLLKALTSPSQIYICIFQSTGPRNTGKPSDMWDFDVRIHPKSRERVGTELLGGAKAPELPVSVTAATPPETNGALPTSAQG